MAGEPYKAVHQADHPNNEPGYVPPPFLAPAEEDEPTSDSKTQKLMARPLELDHSLTEDFEINSIGQFIHVYCNTTETADNFCLDVKKQEDSLMKVCADFTNATERGAHTLIEYKGKEGQTIKSYSLNPFDRNGTVDLRLRVLGKHVQTLTATLKGDIRQVRLFRVVGDQYDNPYERDLVFQEHNRLDITLQPLMTLTDISQISGIYGDGALADQEQIASSRRQPNPSKEKEQLYQRAWRLVIEVFRLLIQRQIIDLILELEQQLGNKWELSVFKVISYFSGRSTSGYHYKKYYRQNYYIYKDRRVGGPVPIHPYSGPASYSYRANGMTYYTSTPNCPNGCETRPKIPMPKVKRIDVLFKDSEGIPTFTLSLRWEENAVVVNTYQKVWVFPNKWADDEIRVHPIPVEDWRLFDLSIVHDGSQLIIYFDGQRFMDFEHRDRSKVLEKVLIQGDCEILRVAKDGQPV
ncbi:unnamed protein product, partial [Mesorhabditis spiculigera]